MVNNAVYHLLVLTWGLRYFCKKGNIRKGCVKIQDWGTSVYFVSGFQILCKACLLFNCFLVIKWILKALFSCMSGLLNFSDLPSYDSNLRKRYKLELLPNLLVRSTLFPILGKVSPNPLVNSSIPLDGLILA